MGSKNCTNEACRAVTSSEWKKGWSLKSGGSSYLCFNCGSAYENSIFCETFHTEDSGWRACRPCGKMVHCGCIASRHLHEYMDSGGVACISCTKRMEIQSAQAMQIPSDIRNGNGTFVPKSVPENRTDVDRFSTERLLQLTKSIGVNDVTSAFEPVLKTPESGIIKHLTNSSLHPSSSSAFANSDNNNNNSRTKQGFKNVSESLPLNFSMTTNPPLASSSTIPPFPGGIFEGGEQSKGSSLQRMRHVTVKPPKPITVVGPELSRGSSSQTRVPRPPPPEGRGRSQLLPRYWPRITDKELQKLSGDLNSTIVPLFEKVLSASDAGRIGRLVLPKACAEAYFPTINQSEGIPIRIQDIKGKEWTFQFRFWPNNNSRMYVLEGVTPCIQSMQVQAGDTVIFSRRDPEGQLVIGCRKAASLTNVQEPQTPALTNGDPSENTSSAVIDNLLVNGGRGSDDSHKQHISFSEKKKARNIKNKRLHMHNEDALELRITWEEAQELFRPSPSSEPTVVMVEDQEFEEFEEPPVFGKRTIFISQPSGEQEQVAQCDSCSKWRRLPVHALISATWTCAENVWDTIRSSCSAPEDINLMDPDFLKTNKEYKKQRTSDGKLPEPSGLDALANAAVLGDITELSSVATTRHPRHRPGCTCIVCIQPPSGKGKHEATCKCNVCLTVRRRFRTLMLRKKRRQSEREVGKTREVVVGRLPLEMSLHLNENKKDGDGNKEVVSDSKGDLDLNSDPRREGGIVVGISGVSLTAVMNGNGGFPLNMCVQPPPPPSGGTGGEGLTADICVQPPPPLSGGTGGGRLTAGYGKQEENGA